MLRCHAIDAAFDAVYAAAPALLAPCRCRRPCRRAAAALHALHASDGMAATVYATVCHAVTPCLRRYTLATRVILLLLFCFTMFFTRHVDIFFFRHALTLIFEPPFRA